MSNDPTKRRSDNRLSLLEQFTKWPYPQTGVFPGGAFAGVRKDFDVANDHSIIWPDKSYEGDLDILIVGCGTIEAAAVAFDNPNSNVLGIDISERSLSEARLMKKRHQLHNLELLCMDLRDVESLQRPFDLVVASGVLHHLPDTHTELARLGQALKPDGALLVSLYRRYPRQGVYMIQEALRHLKAGYSTDDVHLTRHMLSEIPATHHLFANTPRDLLISGDDTDLVDTFLNQHDNAFTVPEVVEMIRKSDLAFQCWYDNLDYFPEGHILPDSPIGSRLVDLPRVDQWAVVELLFRTSGRHRFVLRPKRHPIIDIEDLLLNKAADIVRPALRRDARIFRSPCGNFEIVRDWHCRPLTHQEAEIMMRCDGSTTLLQLTQGKSLGDMAATRELLAALWRCGHIIFDASFVTSHVVRGNAETA